MSLKKTHIAKTIEIYTIPQAISIEKCCSSVENNKTEKLTTML